ncbi:hypothetical protein GCM10020256_02690 [Streptomyces thermocoprophilus]
MSAARTEGVTAFTADALSENHEVLRLFTDLGLRITRRFDGPEVRCRIRLDPDDAYLSAVEARGRTADVLSLRPPAGTPASSPSSERAAPPDPWAARCCTTSRAAATRTGCTP